MKHANIPSESGVYFLKLNGLIIYIGQSANIRQRVCNHNIKNFDSVDFILCKGKSNRTKMEKELIAKHSPPKNGRPTLVAPKFDSAE